MLNYSRRKGGVWLPAALFSSLLLIIGACRSQPTCPTSAPPLGATAQTVAACLPPGAAAEEATVYLRQWGRVADKYWGETAVAHILPDGRPALILTYHADLTEVIWNQQGKLAILGPTAGGWEVVFESPDPEPLAELPDLRVGQQTMAGNWSFHLAAVGDVTGDGVDDLLIEQRRANGSRLNVRLAKLLTADPAYPGGVGEPFLFIPVTDASNQLVRYQIVDRAIEATRVMPNGKEGITHLFRLAGDSFILTGQRIEPDAASLSVVTPDGAHWYAFDRDSPGVTYGLYRLQGGQLRHYDIPQRISSLQLLADGRLYIGAASKIFRIDNGRLVDLLAQELSAPDTFFQPLQLALAANGDLWVAAGHKLLRLGPGTSQTYSYLATAVLVAPDQSVWIRAWDGVAESGCCFYHLDGDAVSAYYLDEALPVLPELEMRIREMRP
jgi:hypothetical protein